MKIALVDTESGLSDTSQKKKLSSESSPEFGEAVKSGGSRK